MNKALYPRDWPQLSHEIKEICGWQCMACGKQCRRPGEEFDGWERTLTLAHITQDYFASVVQVAPLCLPCHFLLDAPYVWVARRRWERWRRKQAGQLSMNLA